MLLYMIRHGAPDYKTDTLLEEGWKQAWAAANRLRISGIDEIYASPMGRARQTAEPLAKILGLEVHIEPWAYELGDESKADFPDGSRHPISHFPVTYLTAPEFRRMTNDEVLESLPGVCESEFSRRYAEISAGLDDLLKRLGYARNDRDFYDAVQPNGRHIALFCHGGMMRVMLSHLFNIPYQFLGATLMTQFTGITVLHFPEDAPEVAPGLISYGDVGHLYGGTGEPQLHYMRKVLF